MQLLNKKFILITLWIFHFSISGNENNEVQSEKIKLISETLEIPFNFISKKSFVLSKFSKSKNSSRLYDLFLYA